MLTEVRVLSAAWWRFVLSLSVLICGMLPQPVAVGAVQCDEANVQVLAESEEVVKEVCTASVQAISFLSDYGLKVRRTVRVNVVESPVQDSGYSAYGSYDNRNDLVQVMSPRVIHRKTPSPQVCFHALDQVQYRGIIAHEVAHALIQQNSRVLPLPVGRAAQEYLATVTQLSVMPDEVRERVISIAEVGPWEPGDVISAAYMAMAPERFAVKSYLHFHQHPAPAEFVRDLLGSKWFYVNLE